MVTVAPSLTETVIALGAADLLVGVSRFDELPEVSKLPRVGGFIDPSVEAVVALAPDLVLVQPSPPNKRAVEKIAALGVPVLAVPMETLAATLEAIREIGRALGRSSRAEALVKEIQTARATLRAGVKGRKPLRVLFIYGFEPLVVAGPGSFAAEFLADAGAVNAAADATAAFSVYSVESAVRSRPDVVIDAADISFGWEKLAALPGLREARWTRVPSQDLLHPGPKLAQGLRELFGLLYPADGGR
ncbi:MAG: ABC transporter substrate-binding protein [Myxococcaceae bacterium]